MLSPKASVLAVAALLLATASGDYSIPPNSVDLGLRKAWCKDQKATCPIICKELSPKPALVNDCDPETLTYGCLCGDNSKPNVSEYTLTLPYHICQEYGSQCVKACMKTPGNNLCASNCREQNPCGAQDPTPPNSTASAVPAATTSSSPDQGADTFNSAGSVPGGAAALHMEVGRVYGLVVLLGGFLAGFVML